MNVFLALSNDTTVLRGVRVRITLIALDCSMGFLYGLNSSRTANTAVPNDDDIRRFKLSTTTLRCTEYNRNEHALTL